MRQLWAGKEWEDSGLFFPVPGTQDDAEDLEEVTA